MPQRNGYRLRLAEVHRTRLTGQLALFLRRRVTGLDLFGENHEKPRGFDGIVNQPLTLSIHIRLTDVKVLSGVPVI